jgi:hypothetical protein
MPWIVLETSNNTGNYVPVKQGNISIPYLIAYLTIFSYFTLSAHDFPIFMFSNISNPMLGIQIPIIQHLFSKAGKYCPNVFPKLGNINMIFPIFGMIYIFDHIYPT